MKDLFHYVKTWPLDPSDAGPYAAIDIELRRRGRAMSQADMMLAALARRMKLTLLTTDRDFEAFPDIHRENWVNS